MIWKLAVYIVWGFAFVYSSNKGFQSFVEWQHYFVKRRIWKAQRNTTE